VEKLASVITTRVTALLPRLIQICRSEDCNLTFGRSRALPRLTRAEITLGMSAMFDRGMVLGFLWPMGRPRVEVVRLGARLPRNSLIFRVGAFLASLILHRSKYETSERRASLGSTRGTLTASGFGEGLLSGLSPVGVMTFFLPESRHRAW
jgi:hypothetical protein